MADYTVNAGHRALGAWPLVAAQVDAAVFASNVTTVQVISVGTNTADIWVTGDSSDPVIPGAHVSTNAQRVVPGSALTIELRGSTDRVKMVSSGTPTVSVQVADA